MNKPLAAAGIALVLAAATASAAPTPGSLLLKKSDMPPGATSSTGATTFLSGTPSTGVSWDFRVGSREEVVTSEVAVAKTAAAAKSDYQLAVAEWTGIKGDKAVALPSYGDEQTADFVSSTARAHGQVIVRKATVVWFLTVEDCGVYALAGCKHGKTPPPITNAQAVQDMKKYAGKLKTRVASG